MRVGQFWRQVSGEGAEPEPIEVEWTWRIRDCPGCGVRFYGPEEQCLPCRLGAEVVRVAGGAEEDEAEIQPARPAEEGDGVARRGGARKPLDIPKDRLEGMIRQGATIEEMAEAFGCSGQSVRKYIKRHGLQGLYDDREHGIIRYDKESQVEWYRPGKGKADKQAADYAKKDDTPAVAEVSIVLDLTPMGTLRGRLVQHKQGGEVYLATDTGRAIPLRDLLDVFDSPEVLVGREIAIAVYETREGRAS